MLDQVLEWLRRGEDVQALRAELVRLLQERDRLAYENAKLRQENRQLRRRLGDRELRVLRSAVADALLLGALHFAGQYTSRRAVTGVMSEHRWWLARALLLLARVHDGQRITAGTPEELELAVEVARQRVEREGLAVLRYRLPLSRQVRWGVWTLVRVCAQTRTSGRVKKRALQAGVGMGAEPTQIYLDHTLTQWA